MIRTRAAIEMLADALADRIVFDEVLSVRPTAAGTVQLRAGGATVEHERVVVCAGRETASLARSAGLVVPVRQSAHVRLAFPVRGEPPERLACLLEGSGAFGEPSAYADPLPGNRLYAVGVDETPVDADGSLVDPEGLAEIAQRTTRYVARALPGLVPEPVRGPPLLDHRASVGPRRVRRVDVRRRLVHGRTQPVQARPGARPGAGRPCPGRGARHPAQPR